MTPGGIPPTTQAPSTPLEKSTGESSPWPTAEFDIGDVHWSYRGPYVPDGKQLADIFTTITTDENGNTSEREFAVWRASLYSGELRVSPIRIRGAWYKGAEELPEHQYTQETRLHPDVEPHVLAAIDQVERPTDPESAAMFDEAASRVTEAFDEQAHERWETTSEFDQRERPPLGDDELNRLLMELPAGYFKLEDIEKVLGKTKEDRNDFLQQRLAETGEDIQAWEAELWQGILPRIHRINELLVQQGVMPDFTAAPVARTESAKYLENTLSKRTTWHVATTCTSGIWPVLATTLFELTPSEEPTPCQQDMAQSPSCP